LANKFGMPMIWPALIFGRTDFGHKPIRLLFPRKFFLIILCYFSTQGTTPEFLIPQMSNEITKLIILCYIMLHSAESSV
jgi:hypothetical protein